MTRRILYYTDTTGFGGAEQCLLNLMEGLDRDAWEPVLLHHDEPGVGPLASGAERIGIRTLLAPPLSRRRYDPTDVFRVAKLLPAARADIFHAHLIWPLACRSGLLAALATRIPVVLGTVHLFVEMKFSWHNLLRQRLLSHSIDRTIVVSHALGKRLREVFGLRADKVQVIHNGIPISRFEHTAVHSASSSGRARVLCLARLDPQKGIPFLLQAAAQVPNAQFSIVGDGPDRAKLEAQARTLGVGESVQFLGHRKDVPELLAQTDLFVLPSLWEGLPLSILEAMAAGKPVIATAVGGTPEAITDGQTGVLVPPSDARALANAIRTVLADGELARRLAERGREHVRREFSVEAMVRRNTELYRTLLQADRRFGARDALGDVPVRSASH